MHNTRRNYSKEIRDHSNGVFEQLNIQLTDEAKRDYERQLEGSIRRMREESRTSKGDIQIAKEAYTKYINSMNNRKEARHGGKNIIRYNALLEARGSICPLWPIC